MKILIAVSSKEYSGPTLSVGMNVSRAFKALTTIVDVGEKISEFSTKDVGMAHERIAVSYTHLTLPTILLV